MNEENRKLSMSEKFDAELVAMEEVIRPEQHFEELLMVIQLVGTIRPFPVSAMEIGNRKGGLEKKCGVGMVRVPNGRFPGVDNFWCDRMRFKQIDFERREK